MNYECFRLVDKPYESSVAVLTSGDFGFLFCIGSHVHSRREATSSGADIFDRSQNIAHVRACSRAAAAGHQAKVGTGFSEGRPSCVLGGFARWDCLGFKADNVRKQQQDYTWFLHYITPSMFGRAKCIGEAVSSRCFAWLEESYRTICGDALDDIFWYPWAAFGFWEVVLDAAAQGLHQKAIGQRWKLHFAFASIAGKSRRITWGVTAACLPRPGGNFFVRLLTPEPAYSWIGFGLRIVPGTDGFWDRNGFYSDLFVYRLGIIIPLWRSAAFAAGNKCGASWTE